jgi:hypothetical protein
MPTDRANPTPRELLVFVLLWAPFCALLGLIASHRPASMLHVGVFTLVCIVIAVAFDAETPVRRKCKALAIPALLGALWLAGVRLQGDEAESSSRAVLWVMVALGVAGAAAMALSRAVALAVHGFWTDAAKPIGWTVSMALLAVVYILVFTPLGLALRAFGYDPMQRGFDRDRASYWGEHPPPPEPRRYFRQF